jgi:hypothetical protein
MGNPNESQAQAKKRRKYQRVARKPEVQDAVHKQPAGSAVATLGASQSRVGILRRTGDAIWGKDSGQSDLAFDAGMLFEGGTAEAQAEVLQRLDGTQRQKAIQRIAWVQGNQHVQRVVAAYGGNGHSWVSPSVAVQTKLEVGEPDDQYEQEADRVADQIVQTSAPPPGGGGADTPVDAEAAGSGDVTKPRAHVAAPQAQAQPTSDEAAPEAEPSAAPEFAVAPPHDAGALPVGQETLPLEAASPQEVSGPSTEGSRKIEAVSEPAPGMGFVPSSGSDLPGAEGVAAVAGRVEQVLSEAGTSPVLENEPFPIEITALAGSQAKAGAGVEASGGAVGGPSAAAIGVEAEATGSGQMATEMPVAEALAPFAPSASSAPEAPPSGVTKSQVEASWTREAVEPAPDAVTPSPMETIPEVDAQEVTSVQREVLKDEEAVRAGSIQRRVETEPGIDGDGMVAPDVAQRIRTLQRGGETLPESTRTGLEAQFGRDFGDVRIHRDVEAAQVSQQIGARAFTVGRHIAFGAGEYAPETPGGKHLLAHELTHVVQQTGGKPRRVAAQQTAGQVAQREGDEEEGDSLWAKIRQIVDKARALAGQKAGEIEGAASAEGSALATQGQADERNVTELATTEAAAADERADTEALDTESKVTTDTATTRARADGEAEVLEGEATAGIETGRAQGEGDAQILDGTAADEGTALEAEVRSGQASVEEGRTGLEAESSGALADIEGQGDTAWDVAEAEATGAGAEIEGDWTAIEGQASSELPAAEAEAVMVLRGLRDEAIDMVEGANLRSGEDMASLEGGKASIVSRAMEILGEAWGPFDPILELLRGGWEGLKGLTGSVWERVKGTAGSTWDLVRDLGENAWAGLQGGWERLKGFAQGLWDGLAGKASAAWERLGALAGNVWNGLRGMVSGALAGLREKLGAALQGLEGMIGSMLTGLRARASAALARVGALATRAWNGLKSLGQGLWSALSGKGGAAEGGVEGKRESAVSSVRGVASGFLSHIGSILGGLRSRASGALNSLRGRIRGALSALRQRGEQALATLKGRLDGALQMLRQRNGLSITGFGNVAQEFLAGLLGRGNAAVGWFEDQSASLLGWLRGAGEKAVRGLQGLWERLKGRIGGFWEGIQAAVEALWQRFRDGVSAILERLRGLWERIKARLAAIWQRIEAAFEALKERLRQAWERVKRSWLGILTRALALWARARGAGAEGWGDVTDDARALKADALQLKARAGQPAALQHPGAILRRLGRGREMDGSVRAKMEGAFGTSLAGVRVHTGEDAARLARQVNARAFTVGNHIAFGTGEYQPSTLLGDALMAHEVAHTVQQRGAGADTLAKGYAPEESAEEMDADRAAIGAVAGNWLGLKGMLRGIPSQALPRLRMGLGLRRCKKPKIRFDPVRDVGLLDTVDVGAVVENWNEEEYGDKKIGIDVDGESDQHGRAGIKPEEVGGDGGELTLTGEAPTALGEEGNLSLLGRFEDEEIEERSNGFSVTPPTVTFSEIPDARILTDANTGVTVSVEGWKEDMEPITLSVEGQGSEEGMATINGSTGSHTLTGDTETIQLRGTDSTACDRQASHPLKLAASMGNVKIAESGGFYVAQAIPGTIEGVLTPRDNFSGRSLERYGVGEEVDLSFTSAPAVSADDLCGLEWQKSSGGGTLTSNTDGTGELTVGDAPGNIQLELKIASGESAGTIVATKIITVVAPSNANMVQAPGTGIWHVHGVASVGFKGHIYLIPRDVSFQNIQFREGTCAGTATGYLSFKNGEVHAPTADDISVGPGDSANGSRVLGVDTVSTGQYPGPFADGTFSWPIPWQYKVGTSALTDFTTANHEETVDATGKATIEKKGAGPFEKELDDPSSGF